MTYSLIFLGLGLLAVFIIAVLWIRLEQTNKRVEKELKTAAIKFLDGPGSIKNFSLLPLVDYYAHGNLETEAGVSYLIQADATRLLLDVGANEKKVHPSPLISNMKALGVDLSTLDGIVISHVHQDHVGGIQEEKKRVFSLSRGSVDLPPIPVWTPGRLACSAYNPGAEPINVSNPLLIKKGIALTGPLPASLFLLGYTIEQSLVFNVGKKGLVLVLGCGHPTIPVILDRVKRMFQAPIYAILGGFHLPVAGGRMNLGPLNLQNIFGSNRMPWHYLNKKDVFETIRVIQKESPSLVALSPHDSSDWAMDQFQHAFGPRCVSIEVGKAIEI